MTIIAATIAGGVGVLFGAIIAGVWSMAGDAASQGDDTTGKENVPE